MILTPRLVCWRPPSVCVVVPLNGGSGVLCVVPRVRTGSSPSYCPCPFMSPSLLFRLCVAVFVVCGGVRWCAVGELCPVLLCCLCVRCHSIVGLGVRLCDGVVLLWNSGDGLCWVEGRWCDGRVVLVVCLPLFFVFLFLFFFLLFAVGVRGSARAAMRARTLSPNTIASLLLCSLFLFPFFLCAPPFFCRWNGGV